MVLWIFAVKLCGTAVLKNPKENLFQLHCVRRVQLRSLFGSVFYRIWIEYVFSPNKGKYGPEKTPYLDTSHAVLMITMIRNDYYVYTQKVIIAMYCQQILYKPVFGGLFKR